ncbi:hypothetical protein GCM10011614_34120 [Novosphingobium colocasiae]|uniref:Uncharacterized protein n=2 Tax=Novosphingobium colocasiae TaxID=1256513 RepID=A0A918PMW5_9SPHN|nr:hypothetical protein GCM10011614_34120 [Novosphingobium colocasiae]
MVRGAITDRSTDHIRAYYLGCYSFGPFLQPATGVKKMKKPIGTTARTGETCPESGVWKVVGTPTTTAPIAKSNRMPPYSGKAVTWQLTSYA